MFFQYLWPQRKLFFCGLIIFITSIHGFTQKKFEVVDSTTFDFGEIEIDIVVNHDFIIRCLDCEEFQVETVRTSCGCTESTWTEKILSNSEKAIIHVTFDAHTLGYFDKKVTVFLKNVHKPIKLSISGWVVN